MNGFKHILYLLGDDPGTADGLWRAVELARRFDSTLTLGVASPSAHDGGAPGRAPLPETGLAGEGDVPSPDGDPGGRHPVGLRLASVDSGIVAGPPGPGRRWRYDLVVKPAGDSPGFRSRLFGSPDRELLETCPAPVWHLNPGTGTRWGPVLAAVDVGEPALEPRNRRIVRLASRVAASRKTALHLVHAWSRYGEGYACIPTFTRSRSQLPALMREAFRERRTALCRLAEEVPPDTPVRIVVRTGHPVLVIPRMASRLRAGLLVTGASTRRGVSGFLRRSTTEAILDRTPCDVLTLGPGTAPALPRPEAASAPETGDQRGAQPASPRHSTLPAGHGP